MSKRNLAASVAKLIFIFPISALQQIISLKLQSSILIIMYRDYIKNEWLFQPNLVIPQFHAYSSL